MRIAMQKLGDTGGELCRMQPKGDAAGIAMQQQRDIGVYSNATAGRYRLVAMQHQEDTCR